MATEDDKTHVVLVHRSLTRTDFTWFGPMPLHAAKALAKRAISGQSLPLFARRPGGKAAPVDLSRIKNAQVMNVCDFSEIYFKTEGNA